MTRIIGGDLGGRRLSTPEGDNTRPTSDRVREALFGSLAAAGVLDGAHVLDLYAGSGAVGLEALSRGAESVLFVEAHAATARVLRRNIAALGVSAATAVNTARLPTALKQEPPRRFDLVFADPPYHLDDTELAGVLSLLIEHDWLAAEADVVVERSQRSGEPRWPEGLTLDRSRRYGETMLWYGHRLWT